MVYDVMITWEKDQQERADGKKPTPQLTEQQMKEMLEKVRKK